MLSNFLKVTKLVKDRDRICTQGFLTTYTQLTIFSNPTSHLPTPKLSSPMPPDLLGAVFHLWAN